MAGVDLAVLYAIGAIKTLWALDTFAGQVRAANPARRRLRIAVFAATWPLSVPAMLIVTFLETCLSYADGSDG